MKKSLIVLLIAIVAISSVFATGQKEKAKTSEITYVTLGDTGINLLKQCAAEFEAETGVKVNIESWAYSDAYQKILTAAAGNNMPDAMYGFSSWTVQFKEAGYTVSPETYVSKSLLEDFSAAAKDVCSVDGTLWALPSYMSVRSVLINKKSLDASGVSEPKTWEEMLAIAPKLSGNGVTNYAYSLVAGHPKNTLDTFLPILWAYGSDVLSQDQKTVAFNTEAGVAALQMFVDLAKYSVPDFGEASINETQANFTSQNAAAYIHNGQGLADLKKRGLDYSWAKILQPIAGPSGDAYSYGVMDVDLMFATGNEDITGKFLEKWHQSKYMGEVINAAGWVPNQSSFVADIPAFSDVSNELVSPFVKMEPQARFKPSITCWEEIQKIMADSITKAVYGEMSAKAAFAKAEIECNEVLAVQ
ncbi:MAG: sugar ABC transporter substrate-binding protein [Clostridia bacterium]|nr:sugar ABC transporter substrate-binding protein [Clostridia bacterium]